MQPLAGKRILVTRAQHQASVLASQLEALGAEVVAVPVIEIVPPQSYAELDAALAALHSFDWLVFTSANAVEVFFARNREAVKAKVAVIGVSTARAVEAYGVAVDLIPERFIAESLAESLVPLAAGQRVLLVRAEEARDLLPQALQAAGCQLSIAPAYRNEIPAASIPRMLDLFSASRTYPDAVTLTSASSARSLVALLQASGISLPKEVALASIGPITTQTARELGYEPVIEATQATIPSLVEALVKHFGRQAQIEPRL